MQSQTRPVVVAWAAAVCLALAGLAVQPAAQTSLPSARSVVDRHIEAIGGRAAHDAVRGLRARGRIAVAAQGLAGDVEIFSARPDKSLNRITVPGVGMLESGYNGKVGWTINPIAGPTLLSGTDLAEVANDAWFDAALHAPDFVKTMTTVARVDFDGRPALKLQVVFVNGREQVEFYDVETGLQIGWEAERQTPLGPVPTVHVARDYRAFGPLKFAATLIDRALGIETVVTVSAIELVDVPPATFDPPPAIRALIK